MEIPQQNDRAPSSELLKPSNLLKVGRDTLLKSGLIVAPRGEPNQIQLLRDMEPSVADEINRHNNMRKPWVPADFFPLDNEGRVVGRVTPDEQPILDSATQAAMLVNLLTEDNLPGYHRVIANNFGLDGPWGTWVNQWTAEEDNHSYAMRAFLDLTKGIDPSVNEQARMEQMKQGFPVEKDPLHTLAYVTFQELATRVSHRNTGHAAGRSSDNPGSTLADKMLERIAKDENLHMLVYRNLMEIALEIAPNQSMQAIRDEVVSFSMPGANISNFQSKALEIAAAGIYDLDIHKRKVIEPILRYWKIFEREDFSGEGAKARDELALFIDQDLAKKVQNFNEKRDSGKLAATIEVLKRRER